MGTEWSFSSTGAVFALMRWAAQFGTPEAYSSRTDKAHPNTNTYQVYLPEIMVSVTGKKGGTYHAVLAANPRFGKLGNCKRNYKRERQL